MNDSCHVWMTHVTHKWVMNHYVTPRRFCVTLWYITQLPHISNEAFTRVSREYAMWYTNWFVWHDSCLAYETNRRRDEGTGTRPDYLMNRDDKKKLRGHSGKKTAQKSRNSCRVNGGGVGAHGQLIRGSNGLSPGTKYKRSKNVFAVTFVRSSLAMLGHDWYSLLCSLTYTLNLVEKQNNYFGTSVVRICINKPWASSKKENTVWWDT